MKGLLLALALLLHSTSVADVHVPQPKALESPQEAVHSDSECLASAIYHEARGEPLEGQRAVYEVIMHRVRVAKSSVCEVVKAPYQFSWVGLKPFLPMTQPMKDMLARVKRHPKVLQGVSFRWFFSGEKIPKWAVDMECHVIGGHRFCREGEKQQWKYKASLESELRF